MLPFTPSMIYTTTVQLMISIVQFSFKEQENNTDVKKIFNWQLIWMFNGPLQMNRLNVWNSLELQWTLAVQYQSMFLWKKSLSYWRKNFFAEHIKNIQREIQLGKLKYLGAVLLEKLLASTFKTPKQPIQLCHFFPLPMIGCIPKSGDNEDCWHMHLWWC